MMANGLASRQAPAMLTQNHLCRSPYEAFWVAFEIEHDDYYKNCE